MRHRISTRAWLIALLAVTAMLGGCAEKSAEIPAGLMGHWVTDDPGYSDRYFEVSSDTLVIDQGERAPSFPIVRVSATTENVGTLYEIDYQADFETVNTFRIVYNESTGVVRTKTRGVEWTRSD